jgi:xylulokinase
MKYIIAYDLGTGGIKTSLFNENGISIASKFKQCETYYPAPDFREQNPEDWWNILVETTKALIEISGVYKEDIIAAACSGHSLGVVPIGKDGSLLHSMVPIWSDARAITLAEEKFESLDDYNSWYMMTGNGFPAGLYSAFKILWYKEHMPELYANTYKFIGTKDYLNYKLTGVIGTDHSYASGSGVYHLKKCEYDENLIKKLGLKRDIFPDLYESCEIVGVIKPEIADMLGLSRYTKIAAGGVDNACMSAGSGCILEGMCYTNLGTSSWIAVSSTTPVLDVGTRPYVFGHLIKGMYVSAQSIFSAGNTFRWVRDQLCQDLVFAEKTGGEDSYQAMDRLAAQSPIGSNGLIFTPTLAGGNSLDKSVNARGTISGLDLKHTRSDMIRASLEGVCLGLKNALNELAAKVPIADNMLIVGGGAKSRFWRGLFADIYEKNITESQAGENAGSIGAMAAAAIGAGLWKDYTPLLKINEPVSIVEKNEQNIVEYRKIFKVYKKITEFQSDIADYRKDLGI